MQLVLSAYQLYSLFVHVNVMRADHVFSRVREDANGKETEVTNKEGCCELNRCNRTQGQYLIVFLIRISHNRTSVHIIRTVILNYRVTHS